MPDRFTECLAFTWDPHWDGQPLHKSSNDPGGWTAWGVTLSTFSSWQEDHGNPPATVEDLRAATKDDLAPIVRSRYWDAVHADQLPPGPDLLVYDFGYGSGSGTSAKLLQEVLGVAVDGRIGPATLAAAAAADAADHAGFVQRLGDRHESFYRSLRLFATFGHGWLNRNSARVTLALAAS
jgi:lysozyme family protein